MILRNQNPVAFSDTLWNSQFLCVNLTLFFMFTNISLLYLYPLALKAMGADYPYLAITRTGNAPVRCALLSRFPVVTEEDIPVALSLIHI